MVARLTIAGLLLLASGCGKEEPAGRNPDNAGPLEVVDPATAHLEPADDLPQPKGAVGELMEGHFGRAEDAREALIRGDIEEARANMKWLAGHDLGSSVPEPVRPLMQVMQTQAAGFGEASTLREAGAILALTLARCGDCHIKLEEGPAFPDLPKPLGDDAKAHMQRHSWGARVMWEGLVSSTSEPFQRGAQVFGELPLESAPLSKGLQQADVKRLTEHLHDLGARAAKAATGNERAAVYGQLLATCATCHRMLNRGP